MSDQPDEQSRDLARDTDRDKARETDVQESDPNADSPEGLAGGMGVSSEIVGHARGSEEPVTYGTAATHPDGRVDGDDSTGLPEQSPGGPDDNPAPPVLKETTPRDDG